MKVFYFLPISLFLCTLVFGKNNFQNKKYTDFSISCLHNYVRLSVQNTHHHLLYNLYFQGCIFNAKDKPKDYYFQKRGLFYDTYRDRNFFDTYTYWGASTGYKTTIVKRFIIESTFGFSWSKYNINTFENKPYSTYSGLFNFGEESNYTIHKKMINNIFSIEPRVKCYFQNENKNIQFFIEAQSQINKFENINTIGLGIQCRFFH